MSASNHLLKSPGRLELGNHFKVDLGLALSITLVDDTLSFIAAYTLTEARGIHLIGSKVVSASLRLCLLIDFTNNWCVGGARLIPTKLIFSKASGII